MLKKILKWTGIVLLSLFLVLFVTVACRQNLKYEAPYPAIEASTDSSIVARGRHLAYGPAHCADCHYSAADKEKAAKGEPVALSGGYAFNLPIASIYAKNITPDKETGIGNMTDAEIARLLRYGVRPDGTAVFDFMPFHNLSDEDMTAVVSFLRSQQPVRNKVPAHDFNTLGKVIKAFMIKPVGPTGEVVKRMPVDSTAVYGGYLANSVANCAGCHTNRDMMTGAAIGEAFAGGLRMDAEGDPKHYFLTPNLTPDSTGKLFGWSQEQFLQRFRQGKIHPGSHMPWTSFARMDDTELKAIYKYLQTLKPVKNKVNILNEVKEGE
jgi:mono/diheme cytochrome c family protein